MIAVNSATASVQLGLPGSLWHTLGGRSLLTYLFQEWFYPPEKRIAKFSSRKTIKKCLPSSRREPRRKMLNKAGLTEPKLAAFDRFRRWAEIAHETKNQTMKKSIALIFVAGTLILAGCCTAPHVTQWEYKVTTAPHLAATDS